MSVAGHHLPIWFDEATGPDDGDVSVWNSATGRFESAPVVDGAIPIGTYVPAAGAATKTGVLTFASEPVFPVAKVPVVQTAGGTIGLPDPVTVFQVQPRDPARAKFTFIEHGSNFTNALGTAFDPVISIGYNVGAGGVALTATEPRMYWQIETNYYEPGGKAWVESFWHYEPPNAAFAAIRPIAVVYDRNAATAALANVTGMNFAAEMFTFTNAAGNHTMFALDGSVMNLSPPATATTNSINIQSHPAAGTFLALDHTGVPNVIILATNGATYGSLNALGSPIFYAIGGANPGLQVVGRVGFYNTAPVAKPTGVAVTAAGIHAALVTLGLIAA